MSAQILIVDDEPKIGSLLERALEMEGFDALYLSDPEEGITRLRAEKFDLVLTDLHMPRLSGLEVLRHAKESQPDTPVVLMTAYGSLATAREAVQRGATDYLSKPFSIDEDLLPLIRRTLGTGDDWQEGQGLPQGGKRDEGEASSKECGPSLLHVLAAKEPPSSPLVELAPSPTSIREELHTLAGGVAHNLSGLLGTISENAKYCAKRLPEDHVLQSSLRDLLASSDDALLLARQLLSYSHVRVPQARSIGLSEQTRLICQLAETALPERVRLDLHLAPNLPRVELDLTQLRQLILDLLSNAVDSIEEAGGQVLVATSHRFYHSDDLRHWVGSGHLQEGEFVTLTIRDTGCGMDEETQDRIFHPFFSTKPKGRGFGLFDALSVAIGHRGGLSVQSKPGAGTTVSVHFPVHRARVDALPTRNDAQEVQLPGILVADDEAGIRRMVKRILSGQRYQVFEAADGQEAREVISQNPGRIQLVLLDLNMPETCGQELLEELRDLRPDLKAVLMSGYAGKTAGGEFREAESTAFLAKPFLAEELCQEVRTLLD